MDRFDEQTPGLPFTIELPTLRKQTYRKAVGAVSIEPAELREEFEKLWEDKNRDV